MANHLKNQENVSVALFVKWVVITAFLGFTGLSYVWFKNQQHATGSQITALEKERDKLRAQNQDIQARISVLSSRAVLERHLQAGFIKMIPITENRIVRVNTALPGGEDELRPVSNSRTSR